ncbi:hypothetical protein [Pseudonocardia sp. MH-G8]|uniref:hypothetical protein n=1 Tax=Pseudonocardia sp. MH-G8 TaxID=1854588 RepID=UPI000BA0ADDD|nr:hypothetical protein [Pseudonocardia sp. MH-G8]OZM79922.1 hypothetical protein CFP66_23245 [Pseudonocardia sp. MH-G8]
MKTYTKQLKDVRVGDVVKGHAGGWLEITKIEREQRAGGLHLFMHGRDVDSGEFGPIYGDGHETRTLRR